MNACKLDDIKKKNTAMEKSYAINGFNNLDSPSDLQSGVAFRTVKGDPWNMKAG